MAKIKKGKRPLLLLRSVENILEFGKYKGCKIHDVMKSDPNWIHWALQTIPTFKLNKNALLLLPPFVKRHVSSELEENCFGDLEPPY
jgi:hypothetical protein